MWEDTMRLVFLGKVRVLNYYEDWSVHTSTQAFKVPSVVIYDHYVKRRSAVKLTKNNLYLRDVYNCQYCGKRFVHKALTYDHVIPKSKGGKTEWSNIVAACKSCNGKKSSDLIEPLRQPTIPTYWTLIKSRMDIPVIIRHYTWERFLDPKMKIILKNNQNKC
jgi:5-methylcytosine-specific restriction endonuclease McrA